MSTLLSRADCELVRFAFKAYVKIFPQCDYTCIDLSDYIRVNNTNYRNVTFIGRKTYVRIQVELYGSVPVSYSVYRTVN